MWFRVTAPSSGLQRNFIFSYCTSFVGVLSQILAGCAHFEGQKTLVKLGFIHIGVSHLLFARQFWIFSLSHPAVKCSASSSTLAAPKLQAPHKNTCSSSVISVSHIPIPIMVCLTTGLQRLMLGKNIRMFDDSTPGSIIPSISFCQLPSTRVVNQVCVQQGVL